MENPVLTVVGLKESLQQNDLPQAQKIIELITNFFENKLKKYEIESAIRTLFDPESGTIYFLNHSINNEKVFKDLNAALLTLYNKLIEQHASEIKFDQYVDRIVSVCRKYIIATAASAKEREKAAIIMNTLFEKYLMENYNVSELISALLPVLNNSNNPGTFIKHVYRLLGLAAKMYPGEISEPHSLSIRDAFFSALEKTLLNELNLQFRVLVGAMEGLDLYLENFFRSLSEQPNNCQRLYNCVKKLSDPGTIKQKDAFRVSLNVFINHHKLFATQIFGDYKYWNTCLTIWSASTIVKDRRLGITAINVLHGVIAKEISIRQYTDENRTIFKFFINKFLATLQTTNSTPYDTRIAIRGFGIMARACQRFMPEMTKNIISLVVQRTELISIANDNDLRDILEHFPDYVESLSEIILVQGLEDKNLIYFQLRNLQNIILRLIRDYHYLSSRTHNERVVKSLLRAFHNISKCDGGLLDDVLRKIILQSVVWTCSHKLVYEAQLEWTEKNPDWKDNVTYKSYINLWNGLLGHPSYYNTDFIISKISDHFIKSLFSILEKLNLRTCRRVYTDESGIQQEFYFCDPNIDLVPEKPKDFHIFLNLVDFYTEILESSILQTNFRRWIPEYCLIMIDHAHRNPLISGYLKLLQVGLCRAEKDRYFEVNFADSVKGNFVNQIAYFLKTLITKAQKLTGELQIACIILILKYPKSVYEPYLLDLIPIFEIAFNTGNSMLSIAMLAVKALESISELFSQSSNVLNKFYEKILPHLDDYLQAKGFVAEYNVKYYRQLASNKFITKSVPKIIEGSQLLQIQKLIIEFLGKLNPRQAEMVVTKKTKPIDIFQWDWNNSVNIEVETQDITFQVDINCLIPRICHLATTSTDRKTKITACELLHAIILFLLGTENNKGRTWKELCSSMLLLGADSDSTIQQMFEPLLMQIMRYIANTRDINDINSTIVMEELMLGISNRQHLKIRDLSAICLREFADWSLKKSGQSTGIQLILENLRINSFDSDGNKRNGAGLAFNNLYRILREDLTICGNYFIDLFYAFCMNFKLTEELNSNSMETLSFELEQVSQSLDHIVRSFKEQSSMFNRIVESRRQPAAIEPATLDNTVLYLLKECGNKLRNYRKKCFKFVVDLAPSITDVENIDTYFEQNITVESLNTICEGEADGTGIKARPTIPQIPNSHGNQNFGQCFLWFEYLSQSLDCYCWFLSRISLERKKSLLKNANIFKSITYFLNKICFNSSSDIYKFVFNSDNLIDGNSEIENRIKSIKCIIIVRLIEFLQEICDPDLDVALPFWKENNDNLMKFFLSVIYEPDKFEFNFKLKEHSQELSTSIPNVMKIFKLYENRNNGFKEIISGVLQASCDHLQSVDKELQSILDSEDVTESIINRVSGILLVSQQLLVLQPIDTIKELLSSTSKRIFNKLFNGLALQDVNEEFFRPADPSTDVRIYINLLMKCCLTLSDLSGAVVASMLNKTSFTSLESKITHGYHFFDTYRGTILDQCNESFLKQILPGFFSSITVLNFQQILTYLIIIIEYKYKQKDTDGPSLQVLCDITLDNIPAIMNCITTTEGSCYFIDLLSNLAMASPYELNLFKSKAPTIENWLLNTLRMETNSLEYKSRIISLLPIIAGSSDIEYTDLTNALEEVQRQHIPLRSAEFATGSIEETGLKSVMNALLTSILASRSNVILEFLIKCTASEEKHILEKHIRTTIGNLAQLIPPEKQSTYINYIFTMVCNKQYEPEMRCTILERFQVPFIQQCSPSVIERFFIDKIVFLWEMITCEFPHTTDGWATEHGLVNRYIGYTMIEVMCCSVKKDTLLLTGKDNPIATPLIPKYIQINVGFVGHLTRTAYRTRLEEFNYTNETRCNEFLQKYQCGSFRAVCSLVSNTQTSIKFYEKIVFGTIEKETIPLWKKLVNCHDDDLYTFAGQEFAKLPKWKQRYVAITNLKKSSDHTSYINPHELQTQNVFKSSLSQDMGKIDLSFSNVRTDAEVLANMNMNINEQRFLKVNLEDIPVNDHEIMPTICGIIRYIIDTELYKVPENNQKHLNEPWIKVLGATMATTTVHRNVRIFLSQFIYNCSYFFKYYSHDLLYPILYTIEAECSRGVLHFFMTDLIAMVLSWGADGGCKPKSLEEKSCVRTILEFLMKNTGHNIKQVVKYNLELVDLMVTIWKDSIAIPSQLLLNMITRSERPDSRENEFGILLNAVFFANNFEPWTQQTQTEFLKAIKVNLHNNFATIYQSASHVLGMMLASLQLQNDENLESQVAEITTILRKFNVTKDEKKFVDCLYGIQKFYPEILDKFREVILYKIPTAVGVVKRLYMEMFLARIKVTEPLYDSIISIGLENLLKNPDFNELALHIVNAGIRYMTVENDIRNMLNKVEKMSQHPKAGCRDICYEIFIYATTKFSFELRDVATNILIKGLMDPDKNIRNRIYEYFKDHPKFSKRMDNRILSLFTEYHNFPEKQFLPCSAQLLIELCMQNSADKQLFTFQERADSKLIEYSINTSYNVKNTLSMTPLFAETQKQILIGSQLCNFVETNSSSYRFTPTQSPSQLLRYKDNFTIPTSSTLPFLSSSQLLNRESSKVPLTQEHRFDPEKLHYFHKRISKNKEGEIREASYKINRNEIKQKKMSNKENINLFRRYRYGDYPDFVLTKLALLLPLRELVVRDEVLARQVFVLLTSSLLIRLSKYDGNFKQLMGDHISGILNKAEKCDPSVFATFLELGLLTPTFFDIQPQTVAAMSRASNMLTNGAIFLESRIDISDLDANGEGERPEKRARTTVTNETNHWLHLSDIYNYLAEYDIVASIFSDRIKLDGELAKAIQYKSNGDFESAQKTLFQIMQRNNSVEHYYAYICYYDCFVEMGMWADLLHYVDTEFENPENLWNDEYNWNFLLPHKMQSELHLTINHQFTKDDTYSPSRFLSLLEAWLLDPIKRDHLQTRYCEELMMFFLTLRDYQSAELYFENYRTTFLLEWGLMSTLNDKIRLKMLLTTQKVSEIKSSANVAYTRSPNDIIKYVENQWGNTKIDENDSIQFWNSIITYRRFISNAIVRKLDEENKTDLMPHILELLFNLDVKQANACYGNKNNALLEQIIARIPNVTNKNSFSQSCHIELLNVKNDILKAIKLEDIHRIQALVKSWRNTNFILENRDLNNTPEIKLELYDLNLHMAGYIYETLSSQTLEFSEELTNEIKCVTPNSNETNIKRRMDDESIWLLNQPISIADNALNENDTSINTINLTGNSHYRLGQYCYDHLDETSFSTEIIETETIILRAILTAMKYESKEARHLFPCILQLQSIENGELVEDFKLYSADVPEWMFLGWLPQIMSRLELSRSTHLDEILLRIARAYPNSLMYSFNVWYNRYKDVIQSDEIIIREDIGSLINMLKTPINNKFIECISSLGLPEVLLVTHIDEIIRKLEDRQTCTKEKFSDCMEMLAKKTCRENLDVQGSQFEKLQNFRRIIMKLSEIQIPENHTDFMRKIKTLRSSVRVIVKNYAKIINLNAICPWLGNYHWCGEESYIEIPGQYTGDRKPDIDSHIKIVKFHEKLEHFSTQHDPLRVTILGSDAKSYNFLMKCGEDMRQDQRIQQILRLMSKLLSENQNCRNNNMFIKTYNVIPVDSSCGLLSWVSDTISLQTFMVDYLNRTDEKRTESIERAKVAYKSFILKANTNKAQNRGDLFVYGDAFSQLSRNEIRANFKSILNSLQTDMLKQAMLQAAMTTETFYVLRKNYATSLAAMSIGNYILGIGDRHLQNILMSTKDGTLVGIDFGFAFGTGTQNLGVPELVPFRLTPIMVKAMSPFGTSGIIRTCMVYALRVFRKSKKILMSCMEVFVKEPNITWLDYLRKPLARNDQLPWTPQNRIDIAKSKLNGHNPAFLTERELNEGLISRYPQYMNVYVYLVKGCSFYNSRSGMDETGLSVEEQVQVLIELATDSSVLGVAYEGFLPFI